MYIHTHTYICIITCVYIYIYIERERDIDIYVCTHVWLLALWISYHYYHVSASGASNEADPSPPGGAARKHRMPARTSVRSAQVKGIWRQGIVLKHRNSWQKSLLPWCHWSLPYVALTPAAREIGFLKWTDLLNAQDWAYSQQFMSIELIMSDFWWWGPTPRDDGRPFLPSGRENLDASTLWAPTPKKREKRLWDEAERIWARSEILSRRPSASAPRARLPWLRSRQQPAPRDHPPAPMRPISSSK